MKHSSAAAPAAAVEAGPALNSGAAGTRRDDISDEVHGVRVPDPYRWLEDASSPEVQAWMTAQDTATRARLQAVPRRAAIAGRLQELWYYDSTSAPSHRGDRYFWSQKHSDKEKKVVYWRQGDTGDAKVLFDPNTWSSDGSIALGSWVPSWDGRRVAYNVRKNNSDEATLHVLDVATGEDLVDVIDGTKYASVSWTPDSKGFYYTWLPPISDAVTVAERPGFAELRHHRLGTPASSDTVAYPATGDARTGLGGTVSRDGRWLIAEISHGWTSSELYLKDLRAKKPVWLPIVTGTGAVHDATVWKDTLYVRTNDGAPKYRLFAAPVRAPARATWKEIVAESGDTLESMSVIGGRLALSYLRNARTVIELRRLDGTPVRTVAIPGLGSAWLSGRPDEDTAYVTYTSFDTPPTVLRTSIASGATAEWSRVTVPFDASRFEAEQVRYRSKDGTEITMFLVHARGLARTGATPTLLTGYGGFNVSMTPYFHVPWAVWLELGGMVAIPNLRGGGEYGEDWHRAGTLTAKQNVFDDFLGAARYLVDQKWTSPGRLAIEGASNGGLLVGAAMVQAPELFAAVVCEVPLLDMVRYHHVGAGRTWMTEYGSAEDPTQFAALHAYSPYHHVKHGTAYPPLLMMSADTDDRVDPMHARKFTAAVQHASSSKVPALLRIERNAGHGGADLVKAAIDAKADTFAFLVDALRM
jgi:prolyl oligopeptidase